MSEAEELAKRLEAPHYWMSGSDQGHEGENDAPRLAAAHLRDLAAKLEAVTAERDTWKDRHFKTRDERDAARIASSNHAKFSHEWRERAFAAEADLQAERERGREDAKLFDEAAFWLEGALNCKSWSWDYDQRVAATQTLTSLRARIGKGEA